MSFLRPVGAVRDVKELEYVLALHQTSHDDFGSWVNGSIDAADVKAFLVSRYGIEVTEDDVRATIFAGLAGGAVEEDACLDLVEVVAILVIPLLVKVNNTLTGKAKDWEEQDEEQKKLQPPPTIVADVLHTILQDTLRGSTPAGGSSADHPPRLTAALLRAILAEHDEMDLLEDEELVRQMLRAAAAGGDEEADEVVLDAAAFARALTADVGAYQVENETKCSTIFSDIFGGTAPGTHKTESSTKERLELPQGSGSGPAPMAGTPDSGKKEGPEPTQGSDSAPPTKGDDSELSDFIDFLQDPGGGRGDADKPGRGMPSGQKDKKNASEAKEEATAAIAVTADRPSDPKPSDTKGPGAGSSVRIRHILSQIDFTADSVYSWEHAVLVWLTLVFSYVFYTFGIVDNPPCQTESFGCQVANAVVAWTLIMLRLTVLGSIVGIGLSMGNGSLKRNILGPILGLVSIGMFIFFPTWYAWKNPVYDSDFQEAGEDAQYYNARYMLPVFGCLLFLFQIKNLVTSTSFVELDSLSDRMRYWFLGSNERAEFRSKQAAIYKVNQMVKRAYQLHKEGRKSTAKSIELKKRNSIGNSQEESTKARALQNYSDSLDETESVGGYLWAYKALFQGELQKTEGIWLSSRLMAAVAIMLIGVIVLFAFSIMIFDDVIGLLYPSQTAMLQSTTCFSTFDANKCYFPYGGGFYTGVGICRGVKLDDPQCIYMFDEIPLDTAHFEKSCETLDEAYTYIATQVPSNMTCSSVMGSAVALITGEVGDDSLQHVDYCRAIADADNETLAMLVETDPDLNQTSIEGCRNLTALVRELVGESSVGNMTLAAYEFCADIFGSVSAAIPSMCDRSLYRARQTILTFEVESTDTEFCQSSLSYCAPDASKTTATCVIGVENLIPFQFEGPTCSSYPEINNTMAYYNEYVLPTLNLAKDLLPEQWMVKLTAAIAIIVGFATALATSLIYIPSAVHTLMKFRSGVIPSLRDPAFITYRTGLQDNAYLMGSMFWGLLVTTLFMVVLVAGGVFLLVWQASRPYLLDWLLPQVIGISITVFIKMGFCFVFMKFAYAGYYRKHPISANIFNFALECWYLALTLAFILSRFFKFLISTGLYVGRIDRPVLADGLIIDMDSLPKVFRKNLLSTESHRHPYIELLGLMYLMKIRHRESFGTAAGSAWRLLFVDALMPWLKKNRIQDAFVCHVEAPNGLDIRKFANEVIGGVIATNIARN